MPLRSTEDRQPRADTGVDLAETALPMDEAAALRQRRLLQLALEEGELGSWSHDLTTGQWICSPRFREQFGLQPEGAVSFDAILSRVVPGGRVPFKAAWAQALAQPGGHRIEVHTMDRGGQSRVLLAHCQVDGHAGQPTLVSGVTVDITGRRLREAALAQTQGLLGQMVRERTRLLSALNLHTIDTIENERKALARDLHDEMGSILTLMSFEIERLKTHLADDAAGSAALAQMAALVDALRQYKHRVIAGLRPPLLQELGLDMALRSHAEAFAQSSGTAVSIHIDEALPALKEQASLAVFRSLQEGLTNVGKYAGASKVTIDLVCDQGDLVMELTDDGVGLPDDALSGSRFGLLGIRERIQALGGSTLFERVSDKGGTRLRLSLPLALVIAEPT